MALSIKSHFSTSRAVVFHYHLNCSLCSVCQWLSLPPPMPSSFLSSYIQSYNLKFQRCYCMNSVSLCIFKKICLTNVFFCKLSQDYIVKPMEIVSIAINQTEWQLFNLSIFKYKFSYSLFSLLMFQISGGMFWSIWNWDLVLVSFSVNTKGIDG